MPAPPTPKTSPAATTTRFGSLGSMTRSVIQRKELDPTPLNLVKVGAAPVALVDRKTPTAGMGEANSPLIPAKPRLVATKMLSGLVGSTAIFATAVPVKTSTLLVFLLRGPVTVGLAVLALVMR